MVDSEWERHGGAMMKDQSSVGHKSRDTVAEVVPRMRTDFSNGLSDLF